jgi:hypothetical protein
MVCQSAAQCWQCVLAAPIEAVGACAALDHAADGSIDESPRWSPAVAPAPRCAWPSRLHARALAGHGERQQAARWRYRFERELTEMCSHTGQAGKGQVVGAGVIICARRSLVPRFGSVSERRVAQRSGGEQHVRGLALCSPLAHGPVERSANSATRAQALTHWRRLRIAERGRSFPCEPTHVQRTGSPEPAHVAQRFSRLPAMALERHRSMSSRGPD